MMTTTMMMSEVNQKRIKTNGIWMHIAEKGTGPLVLLLHGFPEFWFAWRHQIIHLANHGYRAVAPDLRGYGDSDSPLSPSSYTIFHIIGDLIGLLDHFGEQQAFVVGSDWGAVVAWYLSLFRPDRVKALVCLSVPFAPRSPNIKTTESYKQMFGSDYYVSQFLEPGRAERAFARYDYVTVMKKFFLINKTDLLIAPPGMEIIDYLETPSFLPPWITEEELQVFADKFQESGFTGPLNYYRAIDLVKNHANETVKTWKGGSRILKSLANKLPTWGRSDGTNNAMVNLKNYGSNWELLAPWQGSKVTVPAKLIVGDKDIGFECGGTKEFIQGSIFKSLVPNNEVVIIDGHHFIHQENAQQVSAEILSFLRKFSVSE